MSTRLDSDLSSIQVLEPGTHSFDHKTFQLRFPYWSKLGDRIASGGVEHTTAFLPDGLAYGDDDLLSFSNEFGVDRWHVAACYDEWDEGIRALARAGLSVEWVVPEWYETEVYPSNQDTVLLFLVKERARFSLLSEFVLQQLEGVVGLEVKCLDLNESFTPLLCKDAIARAKVCVSLLECSQVEHWLYKMALISGCEGWVSVTNERLKARYLFDENRGRICWEAACLGSLRSYFKRFRALSFDEELALSRYQEPISKVPSNRLQSLGLTKASWPSSMYLDAGGSDIGGLSSALHYTNVVGRLAGGGEVSPHLHLPLAGLAREYFDGLENRAYGLEWAEVFLYRFFRDKSFLDVAIAGSKRGSTTARSFCKIASSLFEGVRLSPAEAVSSWQEKGYGLFCEALSGLRKVPVEMVNLLGLAAYVCGHEDEVDRLSETCKSVSGTDWHFFYPIAERLINVGDYLGASSYLDRELEHRADDQATLLLRLDSLCGLGQWEDALSLGFEMGEAGCIQVGTFLMRRQWLWDSAKTTEDALKVSLKALAKFPRGHPGADRAKGIYSSLIGKVGEAKISFEGLLANPGSGAFSALELYVSLTRLGFDVDQLREMGIGIVSPGSNPNWRTALLYSIAFATDESDRGFADLVVLANRVDQCWFEESHGCLYSVREYLLMLEEVAALGSAEKRNELARRIVARMGVSGISGVSRLSSNALINDEARACLNRISEHCHSELYPRFLDV